MPFGNIQKSQSFPFVKFVIYNFSNLSDWFFILHFQWDFIFYWIFHSRTSKAPSYKTLWLVWLCEEKESGMKIIEKLRGNMVIHIYPGAHKFSLSISHLSWGPQTLLSHHYPYFPSLTLSISNSLLSFTQPNILLESY